METNMARNNPMVMASLEKNIFEHISLMAQEQIELEFKDELVQMQQIQHDDATESTNGTTDANAIYA
jgi:hypothetical protein